jgi:hypothetical protein
LGCSWGSAASGTRRRAATARRGRTSTRPDHDFRLDLDVHHVDDDHDDADHDEHLDDDVHDDQHLDDDVHDEIDVDEYDDEQEHEHQHVDVHEHDHSDLDEAGQGLRRQEPPHDRRFQCKVVVAGLKAKEGNKLTTPFTFSVTLSDRPLTPVTVSYATASGTATSGADFVATSGTLTFPAGVMAQTITVYVKGDKVRENNETFSVNLLKASTNAYIDVGQGVGTIVNDD